MAMNTLEDLLAHELADLYSAETQVADALPKLANAARSQELRTAFEEHLEETLGQIRRLEEIAHELGLTMDEGTCRAMEGLLSEADEVMNARIGEDVVDASLVAKAQRVEHYEIAAYGTAASFARQLRHGHVAELLEQSLDEEKNADAMLTRIAESGANERATARGTSEGTTFEADGGLK